MVKYLPESEKKYSFVNERGSMALKMQFRIKLGLFENEKNGSE
jgi:hypothetical protein